MNLSLKKYLLSRRDVIAPLTLCMLVVANHSSSVGAQELLPPSVLSADPAFAGPDGAPLPDEELGEAMLRGPVHEAFAEQVSPDPEPGLIVNQTPPEPIEELPPEVRPEGERVEWIPGYWGWDDDRQDFIWISGLWRNMPPKLRWLPGYWAEVEQGFQWVAGTWIQEQEPELEYIAQSPPETLELGPVGDAPSANHFWVPGHWSWQDTRYAWSPGFWSVSQVNWVWVPTRYLYTPRGYVYCHGYWDYPLTSRGSLFAPYWFSYRSALRPGYIFRPRVLIALNILPWHFWVRPGYSHYYFGDYYASSYRQRGIHPWHNYYRQSHGIDPLFNYYNRNQQGNVSFYQQINQQFNLSVNQSDRRPPRSFRDQRDRGLVFRADRGPAFSQQPFDGERRDRDDGEFLALGRPLEALTQTPSANVTRVSQNELARMQERAVALRDVERSRRQAETEQRIVRIEGIGEAPAQTDPDADDTASAATLPTEPGQVDNNRDSNRSRSDQLRGRNVNRDAGQGDRSAGQLQRPDRWRLPTMNSSRGPGRAADAATVADGDKRDSSRRSPTDSAAAITEGQGRSSERGGRLGMPDSRPGRGVGSPYQASRPATDNAVDANRTLQDSRDRNQPADSRSTRPPRPDNANRLEFSDRDRPDAVRPEMNRPQINRPEINLNRPETNRPEINRSDRDRPGALRIENRMPAEDSIRNRGQEATGRAPAAPNIPGNRGRDGRDAGDRSISPPPRASLPSPVREADRRIDRGSTAGSATQPVVRPSRPQPTPSNGALRPLGSGSASTPTISQDRGRPSVAPNLSRPGSPPVARQQAPVKQPPTIRQPSPAPQPSVRQQPAPRPPSVRPQPQSVPRPTARQSEVRQPPVIRQPPERQSPREIERPKGGGGGGEGKSNRGGEGKGNRGGGKK